MAHNVHVPPSLCELINNLHKLVYHTMSLSQKGAFDEFIGKIKKNPSGAIISGDSELYTPFLDYRHSLIEEGNNAHLILIDQILGIRRGKTVEVPAEGGPLNNNPITPFPQMLPTEMNHRSLESESSQGSEVLVDGEQGSSFVTMPLSTPTFVRPMINSFPKMSSTELAPQVVKTAPLQFSYQNMGVSPPTNPFNTEIIYQQPPATPSNPPSFKEISGNGLEQLRKEVSNLEILSPENGKSKPQPSFEDEVRSGENPKQQEIDFDQMYEKVMNTLTNKRSASEAAGPPQKKAKMENKPVWKSGISRSRKNNLVQSVTQENDMTIFDSDAVSIYCGYGRPALDKPGRVDENNEDSRKRSPYPSFYLRTETNDFNSVVQLKPHQIALVIESLQISHALTTKKVSIDDFIPENDSAQNRIRWIQNCSLPVTEESIKNQFNQMIAARENNKAIIID